MEDKKGAGDKKSSEHHSEHKTEHKAETPHKPVFRRKLNKKRIAILVIILAIIAIVVLSALGILKLPESGVEILTIDYKIYDGENLLEEDTGEFTSELVFSGFGFQNSKIDEEMRGIAVGEEKTITLEPVDAYGEYDDTLVNEVNRTEKMERKSELNRTTELTIERFKEIFNEEPILDKEYELPGVVWPYKVTEVDEQEQMTKVQAQAKSGDEIPSGITGIKRVVTIVTTETITTMLQGERQIMPLDSGELEIYLDDIYLYFKMNPYTNKQVTIGEYTGFVTELTEEKITIDGNHPYAGKTITIEVKLVKNEKGAASSTKKEIPGAPTMQVFIMSYCPYGVQMLKGLLPVWKEFDDVANIELRFVGYTMHGQKEENENYRIICIREEQYSKVIEYLECFSLTDDPLGCMGQVGVDKGKVDDCMANRAESYFAEDKALNDQYGVQGSPTTLIDGQEVSIYPRSPQDIANALCDTFTSQPSECSLTFSTANPSPGFGGGTSNEGGVC